MLAVGRILKNRIKINALAHLTILNLFHTRHGLPSMGHGALERISGKKIHQGRSAAQKPAWDMPVYFNEIQ
jgi:hypothetical protein